MADMKNKVTVLLQSGLTQCSFQLRPGNRPADRLPGQDSGVEKAGRFIVALCQSDQGNRVSASIERMGKELR